MTGPRWLQEGMRHGLDSGCVLKFEPRFANELDWHMREGVKGDSRTLA